LSLAWIGTVSRRRRGEEPDFYPRRFLSGEKKESAGDCRAWGKSMEFESELTEN
jgi:hypothetical protein